MTAAARLPMTAGPRVTTLSRGLESALPLIGGALRRGAARALAAERSQSATWLLAEAVSRSDDEGVREIAAAYLGSLTDQRCIDAACAVWATDRSPALTDLLLAGEWVASAPHALRVLTALRLDRPDVVAQLPAGSLAETLLDACRDADPEIASRARAFLTDHVNAETREALCRRVVDSGDPAACELAVAVGCVPRDEQQRAVFLFLTGQAAAYEALDFDHQLLGAAYESGTADLRRRVMDRVRDSGRAELLSVVAGGDYRSRTDTLSDGETDFLVRMLADHREWGRLWRLVFELRPCWASEVVNLLAGRGWLPESDEAQAALAELAPLAREGGAPFVFNADELREVLPPAVLRARCHVPGRANDLAFAPDAPVIAIASAGRTVGQWDFRRAKMAHVLRGFDHSVARLAYLPNGTLLCAERTTCRAACGVYRCRGHERLRMGEHAGSVTVLLPLGDDGALSAGRDAQAQLWDVPAGERVGRRQDATWARGGCVAPDGTLVALLANRVSVMTAGRLTDVTPVAPVATEVFSRVARVAAFAPDGDLVLGGFGGSVSVWSRNYGRLHGQALRHPGRTFHDLPLDPPDAGDAVRALAFVPGRGVLALGRRDGRVDFLSWADRTTTGTVSVPGGRVTSLAVSPDGTFLAATDSDSSLSLWDLRAVDAPRILAAPIGAARPSDLAVATAMAEADSLPTPVRQAFRFIAAALRHRFRFDIEIGDVPSIRIGEYDIEIEIE